MGFYVVNTLDRDVLVCVSCVSKVVVGFPGDVSLDVGFHLL